MHFCCDIAAISHQVQADTLDVNLQQKSQASASTISYAYVPPSTNYSYSVNSDGSTFASF